MKTLKVVDDAVLVNSATDDKMSALQAFHFNVRFSGDDWKGSERYKRTEEQFKECAYIEYLPYTQGISATLIKETLKNSFLT